MFTPLPLLALLALAQPDPAAANTQPVADAANTTANAAPAAEAVQASGKRPVKATLDLWGDATGESDFDGDNGTVQTSRLGADFEVAIPIRERSQLTVLAGTSALFYDFGGDSGFGAADPWDTVLEHTVGIGFSTQATDKWSYGVRGFVRSSGEQDADFSDSVIYGIGGGAEYQFNDKFRAGPGIAVITQLEDDPLIIPIITFAWEIADRWSASTRIGTGSGIGFGAGISYEATETLSILAGGGYQSHRFRLDDQDIAPEGVGESTGFPLLLGVKWQAHPQVSFTVRGGMVFAREFSLDDQDGDEIQEVDADSTPILGATLHFDF